MPAPPTILPSRSTSSCCWRWFASGWRERAMLRPQLPGRWRPRSNVVNRVVDIPIEPFPDALAVTEVERPRVLLVDDDERNLLAVATVLEDLGEVVLARSGEEALRQLL